MINHSINGVTGIGGYMIMNMHFVLRLDDVW